MQSVASFIACVFCILENVNIREKVPGDAGGGGMDEGEGKRRGFGRKD